MAALAAFSLAFAILAVFSSTLLMEFTKVLPQPYMDEVFHIPQAQNYCHGNYFFWNDKITTLPGLYFFSQFFLKLFSSIQNLDVADICSVLELRFTNAIFIMFAFIFVYLIIDNESKNIETDNKETKNVSLFFNDPANMRQTVWRFVLCTNIIKEKYARQSGVQKKLYNHKLCWTVRLN